MSEDNPRLEHQSAQYSFPYHYLVDLDEQGAISIHKWLPWGLEYMTYMSFIAGQIAASSPASLLDVGCGDGRLLNLLAGKIPTRVGVDLVEIPILFARAFNPEVQFYAGDVAGVPGMFAVAALIEVMEHIPDSALPEFVARVAGKVSPGGMLWVSVPTTNTSLNKKHYRHYQLDLLARQLAPAFNIEEAWFLVKKGPAFQFFRFLLQNPLGIALPGFWRKMVWSLHRRYTFTAAPSNGIHLVARARRVSGTAEEQA